MSAMPASSSSKSWFPESSSVSQHPLVQVPLATAQTVEHYITLWVHNKRIVRLFAASFTLVFFFMLYFNAITSHVTKAANAMSGRPTTSGGPKYAFATLLSPNYKENIDQNDIESDEYFLSTRVLNYQLRHSNKTRYHDTNVPFLVLCPPRVAENKRRILESEGATIVPVDHIMADWIKVPLPTWDEMLDKLMLWSFVQYDRILYLDADVYLVQSLDGIFEDEAAQDYDVSEERTAEADKGVLPQKYSLAGVVDGGSGSREKPMSYNYMNAGFFMIRPDEMLHKHLMGFVDRPNSFSVSMMEQNLINDVFRHDGPMPWKHMDPKWDTSCPEPDNIEQGWKTIHSKLWKIHAQPCDIDPVAGRMWYQTLGHMESFYAQIPMR